MIAANGSDKEAKAVSAASTMARSISMISFRLEGFFPEEPMDIVSKQVQHLTDALKSLGYEHYNVIMSLSTLSLPVSPARKITDHGLINVNEGKQSLS